MHSVYHFFKDLVKKKAHFLQDGKLSDFPFNRQLLSCKNEGQFPDLAIRLNHKNKIFTGGELIELKDSKTYTVSSFNSTIPSGQKEIKKVITSKNSIIRQQMIRAGNNIESLPVREVFYLIRGKRKNSTKVCLVHGSFFETIKISELITQAFSKVFEERLREIGEKMSDEMKNKLLSIFSEQQNFSRVRDIKNASVKLRFRIMTEVKKEGNILNQSTYPEIDDDTLNFVLPAHNKTDENLIKKKINLVFGERSIAQLKQFNIKHPFNGYFIVYQTSIS